MQTELLIYLHLGTGTRLMKNYHTVEKENRWCLRWYVSTVSQHATDALPPRLTLAPFYQRQIQPSDI